MKLKTIACQSKSPPIAKPAPTLRQTDESRPFLLGGWGPYPFPILRKSKFARAGREQREYDPRLIRIGEGATVRGHAPFRMQIETQSEAI
jgi:hypothetical protein